MPSGLKASDHGRRYDDNGHMGPHCADGMSDDNYAKGKGKKAKGPGGRKRLKEILEVHGDQIDRVLGGLSRGEQADLQRLLSRFGEHLAGILKAADGDHRP